MVARQMDRDIVGQMALHADQRGLDVCAERPASPDLRGDAVQELLGLFGVTKAGIHGLTLWLAGYWAPRGPR
jgi:3-oxoacyl-[acyl-carrier protein] reductase